MRPFRISDRLALFGIAGVLMPALLLVGMATFASQMDGRAREREEVMLAHGFDVQVSGVAKSTIGQSVWDEAVAHLQPIDMAWARFNVGEFFTQSAGFDYAAVVDSGGAVAYAVHDGNETDAALPAFSSALAPLVAKLRERESKLGPLADRVRTGATLNEPVQEKTLVQVNGEPYILVATLVQPDKTASLLKGPAPVVAIGQEVDAGFVKSLGAAYLTGDLSLTGIGHPPGHGIAYARFNDASGSPVMALQWSPRRPGQELFNRAMPLLLLVVAILIGLAAWFHSRARRAIQQLVASEKQASHLALHDSLTGLPNRVFAGQRLAIALEELRRHNRPFAVHCIDLDRFKDVNDTFGHHAGDELIGRVARMLMSSCRQGDTVARLGGDEFAVIQLDATPEKAAGLADRIVKLLGQPVDLSVGRIYPGCSIGVTMLSSAGSHDAAECLREADLALYRAKDGGRGRYCFFEVEMDAALRIRRAMQDDLRTAMANHELFMVYQPQVDGRDEVTGVEALMRWKHPTRGFVSPAVFIPLAEECGLIEELGWFAMRRAFEDGAKWPGIKVGVNVSASQLRLKGFLDTVKALAAETRIDPTRFEFEITEGLLLADSEETHTVLNGIREIGFQLALDDFGTGYSSLSYLKRFPITRIKIDRSFISTLGVDAESEDVVAAIVRLARALHMAVVAEGVETDDQRNRLQMAGCRDIQGYLASKPLPVDMVQAYIDRDTRSAAAA